MVNTGLIQTQEFIVTSESTELETSVRGSILLFGNDSVTERISIIAWVNIDPNDWGGVVFYIPGNWNISGVTSSYQQNTTPDNEAVIIWRTGDTDEEYDKRIEIGMNRYTPSGGGTGVVVIELDRIDKSADSSAIFRVLIGVGSDEKDGIRISHPDYKVIEVLN
ncbi:MAG: hypothetical protein P3T54_01980 [Dehalogenimonas sp.]|uniref:DUF3047 domain-containing protein n=1 Tax=Candidatus Dehalogenimonas loeffleri TaxID=3127115 RepID=A0ABZ2JCG7_9CHLR|nr:hypothetical protein [Dehalogenimonas sp.]